MRSADGIASHVLQYAYLTYECRTVDSSTQGTQVVMQAHALELPEFSVEMEAFVVNKDCTYTYPVCRFVHRLAVHRQACAQRI